MISPTVTQVCTLYCDRLKAFFACSHCYTRRQSLHSYFVVISKVHSNTHISCHTEHRHSAFRFWSALYTSVCVDIFLYSFIERLINQTITQCNNKWLTKVMHFNACTKKVTNEQTDYLTIYLCLGNSFTSPHLVLLHNYSPSTCSHFFCRGYLVVLLNFKITKEFLVLVSTILLCWLKPEAIMLFHCFTVHFFNSLNNENQPLHFTLNNKLV